MLPSKPVLTLAVAKLIASAAEQEAVTHGWNMVIAIVDDGGHLLHFSRMDGGLIASVTVATEKARCAVHFKRTTKVMEEAVAAGRIVLMSIPGAVPVEGGIPLFAGGHIIGAIGVSGGSASHDGQAAQAGADELARILKA
ncbi:MAG: heme-binding protein [Acidobacteriota bacterium]